VNNPIPLPSQKVSIRRAQRADAPALLRLIVALAEFEKLTPPDAAAQERLIEHGFGERPKFEAWLAFWEGAETPVGYSIFFETYSTFLANPTLYLEDIFVLPEYRGKGLSKWLMEVMIGHPHLQGLRRWILATKDAHGLYSQFGFHGLKFPERWMELPAPNAY